MRLRELKEKDAPLMLEWMHDDNVIHYLKANFAEKTIEDCLHFIKTSANNKKNLHMAVADDRDEYMGTVSLKNISEGAAEFAVAIRSCAMGTGCSRFAMKRIMEIGFEDLCLSLIYWYVSPANTRAVRFYDKNGYSRVSPELIRGFLKEFSPEELSSCYWYLVQKDYSGSPE